LRIHHVIASIQEKYGGPSQSVPALCGALAERGHEVALHVYSPAPIGLTGGYRVRAYHWAGPRRLGLSRDMPFGLRQAARNGDIMHVHGLWMLPNVLPAWAVRGTRCKLVNSPRGMLEDWALRQSAWAKRAAWLLGQGAAMRASDMVHATADTELASIRRADVSAPVAVIPNGVALPPEDQLARFSSVQRTLLFLSRIHPKKGIDVLLRAWVTVQAEFPEWKLRVIGPGERGYIADLREMAADLRAERVIFEGPLFGADKTEAFRAAELFTLPSHSENFGLSVAEALAHGLPVIVGRGAPWSGIEPQGCGIWTAVDQMALTDALRRMLVLPSADLRAMGLRGRAWMSREYSWENCARMMEESYAWLTGSAPQPPWLHTRSERPG
jgi:glycosyltransferase involved in cell wall biosynthesis